MHALLIGGFLRSPPVRQMGEKGGSSEGVSVAMVDAADLRSKNTFAEDGMPPGLAAAARPATPPAREAPPLPEAPEPPVPPPASMPEQVPEPASPAEAVKQPAESAKRVEVPKQQESAALEWPADVQPLPSTPPQAAKASPSEREPAPKPEPAQKPEPAPKKAAKLEPPRANPPLQLALPDTAFIPGGRGAAFARPAGITRSGENDEFGRGVIRALRKTMPSMDSRGRVTVKILLSQDGNLIEVQLVRSSGIPLLDQNVMFAVRQSSFPFPPPKAPLVDRTFLVTYVYE